MDISLLHEVLHMSVDLFKGKPATYPEDYQLYPDSYYHILPADQLHPISEKAKEMEEANKNEDDDTDK